MLSQKHNIEWQNIDVSSIKSKRTKEGKSYLELFLLDYSVLFNKKNLSASCGKCITSYHNQYKEKISTMSNESKYVLKKKYIGISLKKSPSYKVNNSNITDKIGAALLKEKGSQIFEKFPVKKESKKIETSSETTPDVKKTTSKKTTRKSAVSKK